MIYKYKGRVIKVDTGEAITEPYFVFRYKDKYLPQVLSYFDSILAEQSLTEEHPLRKQLNETIQDVIDWQTKNKDKIKLPD